MNVMIGNARDPRWSAYLARVQHDFYVLPKYVELCAGENSGEAFFICAERDSSFLLIPLIKRRIENHFDAASPYGYPGFVGQSKQNSFFVEACEAIKNRLFEAGFVSLFLRLDPILNMDCRPIQGLGELVHHGDTVLIDLDLSDSELWRQTCSSNRNQINQAMKRGDIAIIDNSLQDLELFIGMYHETMRRVSASPFYLFDHDYFMKLKEILGSRLFLATTRIGEDIAAAALFTEINGVVQYHLSASSQQFSRERPTKTMLHAVRQWAKKRGNRWLHLGGGLGAGNDSLFEFKAGFSEIRRSFYTLRAILNPTVYRHLANSDDLMGYFPGYRT